jgi:uncharacterized protein (DUF1684 family)
MSRLAALSVVALMLSAAQAATQRQIWKAELVRANAAYATEQHAILKINDAAYIHAGETVSLVGQPGKPASWYWVKGARKDGVLVVSYSGGRAQITKRGASVPAKTLERGIDIARDIDVAGGPTQMAPGQTGLRIMVFNQQNGAAKAFKGLDYFPYDPAYRVTARFKPDSKMAPRVFRTSRGQDKQFFHAGDAVFVLQGKTIALPLYADANVPSRITTLSAFFTDGLTGKGAYSAGRYVDAESFGKFPPAKLMIDFNSTYNPNCARSPFYNCPFAVDNIPLVMRAGERDPHLAH